MRDRDRHQDRHDADHHQQLDQGQAVATDAVVRFAEAMAYRTSSK